MPDSSTRADGRSASQLRPLRFQNGTAPYATGSTFIFILFAFEYLASGHLFPLDMLPPALQHVLAFTPFPSMLYAPIGIYMGEISGNGVAPALLTQLFWVVMMYGLARFMWRRGIKKYAAFGD